MRFHKFQRVSGMVWYVLSKVVRLKGMSFHSTHATSHALQPMQVVVSTSLQTSRSRCMPWPAEDPEWPEIISVWSALRSAILHPHLLCGAPGVPPGLPPAQDGRGRPSLHRLCFFDLHQKAFEFWRKRVWIDYRRRQLICQRLRGLAFIFRNAAETPVNGD